LDREKNRRGEAEGRMRRRREEEEGPLSQL
jgi:hypothetical protein